ncbi:unnamed protein product [Lactuca saligna]|uniref:Uncharacterized protein n=1 Tax=Lactuca saligna TaxID=75948 RepID=A0AA36EK62_LACSI|nr:unnamed protein product [Lactuca saligna]
MHVMKSMFQRKPPILSLRPEFHSQCSYNNPQVVCNSSSTREEFMMKILDRRWTLKNPDTKVHQINVSRLQTQPTSKLLGNVSFSNNSHPSLGENLTECHNDQSSFYIVRDDLLHPLVNGNKARKLDALLPLIEDHLGTDVAIWDSASDVLKFNYTIFIGHMWRLPKCTYCSCCCFLCRERIKGTFTFTWRTTSNSYRLQFDFHVIWKCHICSKICIC